MPNRVNSPQTLLAQIQTEVSRRATELAMQRLPGTISAKEPVSSPIVEWFGSPLQWGEVLHFGQDGSGNSSLRGGWSVPEPELVWSDGPWVALVIPPLVSEQDILLRISATGFTGPRTHQQVKVLFNGHPVATWHIRGRQICFALIPSWALKESKEGPTICFQIDHPISPAECGLGGDPRRLGIALHSLDVRPF